MSTSGPERLDRLPATGDGVWLVTTRDSVHLISRIGGFTSWTRRRGHDAPRGSHDGEAVEVEGLAGWHVGECAVVSAVDGSYCYTSRILRIVAEPYNP